MNTQYSSICYNNNTTCTFLQKNPVIHCNIHLPSCLYSWPLFLTWIRFLSIQCDLQHKQWQKNKYSKLPDSDFELMNITWQLHTTVLQFLNKGSHLHWLWIGSLSNDNSNGNGSKNITQKVNLCCFKHHHPYSTTTLLICQMLATFSGVEFYRTVSKFKKRKRK